MAMRSSSWLVHRQGWSHVAAAGDGNLEGGDDQSGPMR
jgi:hypothetical protein